MVKTKKKPMVKFNPLTITEQDMEYLKTQAVVKVKIIRMAKVPDEYMKPTK